MADASRRFPPPWRAEPIPGGYAVRDANGQALAYVYSHDNEAPQESGFAACFIERPEGRRRFDELLAGDAAEVGLAA
jgi:hypothetical protein